ncbi:MAG: hypothetical protein AAF791_13445 [Bacteroidota bacterium]
MIRHVASRREDHVSDAVGCLRLFGSVFVCTGLGALSVALMGGGGMDEHSLWSRLGVAAIGAAHLCGGLFVGWRRTVRSRITRSGVKWEERRPLRPTRRRQVAPSAVARLGVLTDTDTEGDEVYRVALHLTTGETLPLTHLSTASRVLVEAIREAVARRLGSRLLPSRTEADRVARPEERVAELRLPHRVGRG